MVTAASFFLPAHPSTKFPLAYKACKAIYCRGRYSMRCQRLNQLEDERKTHSEAVLFLSHHRPMAASKAVTHKLVLKEYRADEARLGRAIVIHQRHCPDCRRTQ